MKIFYSTSNNNSEIYIYESKDDGALHNEEYAKYITQLLAHDFYYKKSGRNCKWPLMFYLYDSIESQYPLYVFYVEFRKYTKFTVSNLNDKEFSVEQ